MATVRIRNQATVGGTLVHADPNQDLPPMLMVHEAVARIRGPQGVREVPVTDLFAGFFETVLEEGELLEAVHVPAVPAGLRTGYLKFLPRTRDDYPTVSVAAGLAVSDGRCADVRLAVAGGGATPIRCRASCSSSAIRSSRSIDSAAPTSPSTSRSSGAWFVAGPPCSTCERAFEACSHFNRR